MQGLLHQAVVVGGGDGHPEGTQCLRDGTIGQFQRPDRLPQPPPILTALPAAQALGHQFRRRHEARDVPDRDEPSDDLSPTTGEGGHIFLAPGHARREQPKPHSHRVLITRRVRHPCTSDHQGLAPRDLRLQILNQTAAQRDRLHNGSNAPAGITSVLRPLPSSAPPVDGCDDTLTAAARERLVVASGPPDCPTVWRTGEHLPNDVIWTERDLTGRLDRRGHAYGKAWRHQRCIRRCEMVVRSILRQKDHSERGRSRGSPLEDPLDFAAGYIYANRS
jgi:hypothetical protein